MISLAKESCSQRGGVVIEVRRTGIGGAPPAVAEGAADSARPEAVLTCMAWAQGSVNVPRVGLLVLGSQSSWDHVLKLFRQRLRELGYVEGRNIHLEERYTDNNPQRLAELARELAAARVDVIVAVAVAATRAAREATQTIPIVMVHGAYAPGIYETLSRPGGSVTGTISMTSDLAAKHFQILHELFPRIARVAILSNLENPGGKAFAENAVLVARRLQMSRSSPM